MRWKIIIQESSPASEKNLPGRIIADVAEILAHLATQNAPPDGIVFAATEGVVTAPEIPRGLRIMEVSPRPSRDGWNSVGSPLGGFTCHKSSREAAEYELHRNPGRPLVIRVRERGGRIKQVIARHALVG